MKKEQEFFDDETLHREKQIVERELVSFYSSFNQIANISAELVCQTPSIYFNPKYQGEHTIVSVCYRKIVNGDINIFEDSLLILFATMADACLVVQCK